MSISTAQGGHVSRQSFYLFLLASCFQILVGPHAHALTDTNDNGMSDPWERQYNNYSLFPATFDPQADDDGDGCSNLDESIFGTDPLDANPPAGFLRSDINHIPASYLSGGSEPELLTPEAFVITWPTLIGKQYSLLFSPDLTPGSWISVESAMAGTGSEIQIGVTPTQEGGGTPEKLFWRVAVNDIDTDGDGFTDYEEFQKGSNPLVTDRDDDGLPDDWETANGISSEDNGSINPNNGPDGDADGDGVSNIRELLAGTKANDANDFPEELSHVFNRVHGGTQYDSSTTSHSGTINFISWNQSVKTDKSITTEVSPAIMVQELAELNNEKLPATLTPAAIIAASPQNVFGSNLADPGCEASANASMTHSSSQNGNGTTGGQYSSRRCWVHAPAKPVAREYYFFRYKSHVRTKQGEAVTTEITEPAIVTLIIPANQTYSESVDLSTTTTYEADTQHMTSVVLRHISIIPDDNMAGVIGDMIVSNKGINGEKHFVTPKEAGQFVNLKAAGIEALQFGQLFEWECDATKGAQGLTASKYKIKRDNAEQIVLKIKAKVGGAVVAKINVWVVWAEVINRLVAGPVFDISNKTRSRVTATWRTEAFIIPGAIIILADDIPDLRGYNKTKVPNWDKPHAFDGEQIGDATFKWDLTKQWRERDLIPTLSSNDLRWPVGGKMAGTLPNPNIIQDTSPSTGPDGWPTDPLEGNDDSRNDDQPYANGILTEDDPPTFTINNSAGSIGDTAESRAQFRCFVRLEINEKWYIISKKEPWRLHGRLTKVNEATSGIDLNQNGQAIDDVWQDADNPKSITDDSNLNW